MTARPSTPTSPDTESAGARERVQKVMAQAALGSRRALERDIEAGHVKINGQAAALGATVGVGDRISWTQAGDVREFVVREQAAEHQTLMYHKPEGVVTSRQDPEGRRTVFDHLPEPEQGRWIAVGRLDINTTGLLLLTTDGDLAHRLMHPSTGMDREYLCRVRGQVSPELIDQLIAGVELDDGPGRFTDVVMGEQTDSHTWYTVTLMEGRQREVRRLWEHIGAQVARLKRVRYGPVFLPASLRRGRWERLAAADHRLLRREAGLPPAEGTLQLEPLRASGATSGRGRQQTTPRRQRQKR